MTAAERDAFLLGLEMAAKLCEAEHRWYEAWLRANPGGCDFWRGGSASMLHVARAIRGVYPAHRKA